MELTIKYPHSRLISNDLACPSSNKSGENKMLLYTSMRIRIRLFSAFFAQQMTLDSWFSHFATSLSRLSETILGAGMTISYMLSDYMVNDDGVDLGVCAVAFPNETLKFWWRRDGMMSPTSESFSPLDPRDEGLVFIFEDQKWFVTTAGNMFLMLLREVLRPVCWGLCWCKMTRKSYTQTKFVQTLDSGTKCWKRTI